MGRRKGMTVLVLLALAGGMAGLVAGSVPFYRWFCRTTGYGGTTRVALAAPGATSERMVTVRFNADTARDLPWDFRPAQTELTVRLGEPALAMFTAHNRSSQAITGTATFNVTPNKAGRYVNKIECFCFTEQTLYPGERADMPVSFYIDPALADDIRADEVTTITLSYTFFQTPTPKRTTEGKT